MADVALLDSYVGLVTLREIRRYIVRSHAVMMAVFVGLLYGLFAMLEAGMLVLQHLSPPYYAMILWGSAVNYQPWNFPGLLIVAPWGLVSLPLYGTISMVFVTVGVAIGMTSAVLLAVALLRRRSRSAPGPTSVGGLAGLTPALIGVMALGACCSTTAAATVGVGVIAQITGTTETNLLINNWYLGVFQMAVVWVSLLAQEMLLRVYGHLFDPALGVGRPTPALHWDRRTVAGGAFRVALLVGGVAWVLTAFEAWTTVDPGSASAALWFDWAGLHFLPGAVAMLAALVPRPFAQVFESGGRSPALAIARVGLVGVGGLLLLGAPPPLAGAGVLGLGNELLGVLGVAPAWGALAPALGVGGSMAFRWTFEYLLLGGFAVALGLRPHLAVGLLGWSSRRPALAATFGPTAARDAPAPDSA